VQASTVTLRDWLKRHLLGTTICLYDGHPATPGPGRPAAEVVNKDATANPQPLDWFVAFARARDARMGRAS
jgi:hypothetical protein